MRTSTVRVRSADVVEFEQPRAVIASATPARITLVNIGPAIQGLIDSVRALTILVQQVLANQQSQAQSTALTATSIAGVASQLRAFAADEVKSILDNTVQIQDLLEAQNDALGSLATEADQQIILQILEAVIGGPDTPVRVGIDPTATATSPQAPPPGTPVSVGIDPTATAALPHKTPTRKGP